MTTQYTTILKLALPVQGELSGTWGDVVNDNITQMVEQAIAGKATVNSWTANSHTLTTADGTTSESRCAILELTDSGTALTGAGTVVCPTNTKLYIVDNNTAQIITVKTSGGTGVAVPVGKTMLVYCDGTNVVEGVTHANSLSFGTSTVTADKILDEDNMASDSATAIATQQSIKAYVDSQVGTVDTLSEILANGNTTGANDIAVDTAQKVQFRDAAIYINSSVDGQLDIVADTEIQIAATTIDINGNADVSGTLGVTGVATFTGEIAANGGIALGDGDKATFGDGDDLQIYHDTHSYIQDTGTGSLFLLTQGAEISLFGNTSSEYMGRFIQDGSVELYHNGLLKLATTATGIDVTGTVTADGLTVDGDATITSASTNSTGFTIGNTAASGVNWTLYSSGGGPTVAGSFGIYNNSTSTNALILSASNNLGLGMAPTTNNISKSISLVNGGSIFGYGSGTYITANSNYNGAWNTVATGADSRMLLDGNVIFSRSASATAGSAGAVSESMRIDSSSGNVGIGTSSTNGLKTAILGATGYPATSGTTQTGVLRLSGGTGLYNVLDMGVNESTDTAWMQATRANSLGTYDSLVINPYGGNVGIGTSSPNSYAGQTALTINSTGVARLDLDINDAVQGYLLAEAGYIGLYAQSGNYISMGVVGVGEAMHINSAGNVGIGATGALTGTYLSKAFVQTAGGANFALGGGSDTNNAVLSRFTSYNTSNSNSGNESSANFYGVTSIESIVVTTDSNAGDDSGGSILFKTKPEAGALAERMRILADGSVVQGNTVSLVVSNYSNQAGAAWHEPDEHYEIATTGNRSALEIGKNNANDGELVTFRKQANIVGSIGSFAGSKVYIGSPSSAGAVFATDGVMPVTDGSLADGAHDLGQTSARWKDLYLSGGAYLGGTAAANHAG